MHRADANRKDAIFPVVKEEPAESWAEASEAAEAGSSGTDEKVDRQSWSNSSDN